MRIRTAVVFCGSLLLAACGSSPKTNYFELTTAQSGTAQPHVAFPVQVVAVHIPPSLDRQEMVRVTKGAAVRIRDTERWSAPLGEMIRNVLSRDLQTRMPRNKVVLPDAPTPNDTRSVVVSITAFGADSDGRVVLSGSWSLLDGKNSLLLRRDIDLHVESGSDASQVAAGMSQALGDLASGIAAALAAIPG
jgi:hypothetical protein